MAIKNVIKNIKGQGMTEYMIIVALIAVASITLIELFGHSVSVQFGKITSSLQGENYKATEFQKVTKNKTKKKSLKDFAHKK